MSREKLARMTIVYVTTSPAASDLHMLEHWMLQNDQDGRKPGFEASPGAKVLQMHGLAPDSHTPGSMHA
eukprot:5847819-Pyramimonas_sp.AAC.1